MTNRWRTVKTLCIEFFEHSTIHGVTYASEKNKSWFEKVWWILVVGLCTLCCGKLIYDAWIINPIIISFTEKPTSTWQIPFPTVSICPKIHAQTKYVNLSHIIQRIQDRSLDPRQLSEEEQRRMLAVDSVCPEKTVFGELEAATNCNDCLKTLREIRIPPEDIFVECEFQSWIINCTEAFEETIIGLAICYTFNGFGIYRQETTGHRRQDWSIDGGYTTTASFDAYPRRALGAGTNFGLSVLLKMNRDDIDYTCFGTTGFWLDYNLPYDTPSTSTAEVHLNDAVTFVLKPSIMKSTDKLRRYSIAKRKCYFSYERPLKYFKEYTKQNCEVECEVNLLLEKCGCMEIFIEDRGDVDVCAPSQYDCTYSHIHQLHQQSYFGCNCLPSCSSVFYEAEVSVAKLNVSDLRKFSDKFQYSQVLVYLKESQFMTSQRTELYGDTEFLASCGGLLGLCLGVSVISLFEVVYFCTMRLWLKHPRFKIQGKSTFVESLQQTQTKSHRLVRLAKDLAGDYSRKTTIQGIRYVADANLSLVERIWWAIVVGLSILFCGSLILNIYSRRNQSPVVINYESEERSITQVPFPAVTVCSQFVTDSIGDIHHDLKVLKIPFFGLSSYNAEIVTAVAQVCDPDIFGDFDPKNETNCDKCSENLLTLMGKVDEILKVCYHTDFETKCSEMFKAVVTEDGVCFTYNGLEVFRDVYKNQTEDLKVVPKAGSMYPLIVFLRVCKWFNDGVCKGLINGFRVYLHLPNEVPRISKHYYMVPYQQIVELSISPRMIFTAPELRDIPVDKRQCFFNDERYLRFFKHYTQSNCEFECVANMTVEKCGCLRFHMPTKLLPGVKICGIGEIRCYQTVVQQSYAAKCNCLPACTSITYDAEINQQDISEDSIKFRHSRSDYIRTFSISEFSIAMKKNQFVALRRSQLYGKTEFLANCGGLLGLFLGFSMVSILEFVYFCVIRLFCKIKIIF